MAENFEAVQNRGDSVCEDKEQNEDSDKANSADELNDDNPFTGRDNTDGCQHYARKCAFISPCCGKLYTCRVCHDEEEEHEIDRFKVTQIQCLKCSMQQLVSEVCCDCGVIFADYFCSACRLFDRNRKQFHCDACGLCRVGGREKFFHCPVCDLCLSLSLKDSHKCIERASRSNCPVCMEDLHTSRIANHVLPCSHIMHVMCFKDMIKTGNYACPMCAKSMVSMKEVWELMDREVEATVMPHEYDNMHVQILCRDCNKEGRIKFHVVGLKCEECGSYNTCRAAEPHHEAGGEGNEAEVEGNVAGGEGNEGEGVEDMGAGGGGEDVQPDSTTND